jgi:hypothetical protein
MIRRRGCQSALSCGEAQVEKMAPTDVGGCERVAADVSPR